MDKGLPYRVMKVCLNNVVVMFHNRVNILKSTEMYTLKWWLLWHLKHISKNKDDLSEKNVLLWNRCGGGKWVLVLTLRPHSLHKKVDGSPRSAAYMESATVSSDNKGGASSGGEGRDMCHQLYVPKPVRHSGVAFCNERGRQVFDKCPLWGPGSSWTPGGSVVRS